jgi:hypothetical protein
VVVTGIGRFSKAPDDDGCFAVPDGPNLDAVADDVPEAGRPPRLALRAPPPAVRRSGYERPLPAGFGGGGGGGGGGFGNVQVAVPKRGPPVAQSGPAPFPSRSALHSRGSTGNTSSSRYGGGGMDLQQGAPAARNVAPAMARGPPTAGGGRISTSNETSADMKAIFGMGGRR